MATQTENVGLTKPAGTERYSLDVVNGNTDILDRTLGALLDAVGVGTGTGLTDKIGENTDTAAGTVFGDLHIIKNQTEQNGTDIANVKTVVDSNAEKLNALQTSVNNTKAVVDLINTQTESVKQTGEQTFGKMDEILSVLAWMKTATDRIGSMSDTMESGTLFGQFKTLLANVAWANTNIATLLTQTKGVKNIYAASAQITNAENYVDVTIPAHINPERVVILVDTGNPVGLQWSRAGNMVRFTTVSAGIIGFTYQFVEFY